MMIQALGLTYFVAIDIENPQRIFYYKGNDTCKIGSHDKMSEMFQICNLFKNEIISIFHRIINIRVRPTDHKNHELVKEQEIIL